MYEKQFEKFLANQFFNWARLNIEKGFRYQFKSPNPNNGALLHVVILEAKSGDIEINGTHVPYILCGNIKLLTVLHSETGSGLPGYTENFISLLRDEVASQQENFLNSAMLVIHNSLLDTLINSAEDMSQPGYVWNPVSIKSSLKDLIDQKDSGREISEGLLDYQFNVIIEDDATMFGFKTLYDAVIDGDIVFRELDMFDDPLLFDMDSKPEQIKKRLDENRKLYNKINHVVENYPEDLIENLPDLGEKFIKENFYDDEGTRWKNVSFADYRVEQERNRSQQLKLDIETTARGQIICRAKSDTSAGQRNRHHLLSVNKGADEFDLELSFIGGTVEKSEVIIKDSKLISPFLKISITRGSKRSKILITGPVRNEPLFFRVDINRDVTSEKYQFHCLVVTEGQFYIEAFRNNFIVDDKKSHLLLQTEDSNLVLNPSITSECILSDAGEVIDSSDYGMLDFEKVANESDEIKFTIKNESALLDIHIEGAILSDSLSFPLLLDKNRFVHLFNDAYFGVFHTAKNKVLIDNREVAPVGRRLMLLQYESKMLSQDLLYDKNDGQVTLTINDIESYARDLSLAYRELYEYLKESRTLISLVSWGQDFSRIVKNLIDVYQATLESMPKNELLTDEQKRILNIGMFEDNSHSWLAPFHPITLSYYLFLSQKIQEDKNSSFNNLPEVTVSRLNPQGLIPFLYHARYDFTFSSVERENCLWIRLIPQINSSYLFVRKLVKDKVVEFRKSFAVLFDGNSQSPLIINSINNGINTEVFLGLVDYIRGYKGNIPNIHVNLYDDKIKYCEFDSFSEASSYDEIKVTYGLDKGKARENADSIIDKLRTRLTYSKFTNSEIKQSYAHLSFFRNNEKVESMQVNIDEEQSGVVCHGLISGEASYSKQQSYVTGFGLKGIEYTSKSHLVVAKLYSTLLQPAKRANTPYRDSSAISLAVSDNFRVLLERSYDSSIWTTIIDPKVTLEFFQSSKDVVLIHYSDQYTNSASYDAITVSRQTDLYQKILEKEESGSISELNAFNGEWLLKMITADPKIRKERKGILGAYKFVSCMLQTPEITWVPLSIGELIRVSGNIGLKISDSDFSRQLQGYKSGAISDDVLFVGFKDTKIYLLPLEVKTGFRPDYKKAVSQSKELKRYLSEDILGGTDLSSHLYRGLFIRQILLQVDKYQLYDVYDKKYFNTILDNKEKWLQGDYTISKVSNYPEGLVLAHVENNSCFEPKFEMDDNILKIELPLSLLDSLVTTPLKSMLYDMPPEALRYVPEEYILKDVDGLASSDIYDANDNSDIDVKDISHIAKQKSFEHVIENGTDIVELKVNSANNESLEVLIGHDILTDKPILWEPTNTAKYMNPNAGIIGTMGTGKTQCTKSVITQLYRNQDKNVAGEPIGMLIFDYKSDYVDDEFCKATEAKKFKLFKLPYNPLSLFGDTPMLPIHTAAGFSETMSKAYGLGKKQQLKLENLINEAYSIAGIYPEEPDTWTKPAPSIENVWDLFLNQEKVEEDSLYAALSKLIRFKIFETDSNKMMSLFDLIDGVVVVELAGYPGEVQNLIVALTLDLFYSQMQKKGKPTVKGDYRQLNKLILVDEADNFMTQNFPSLRKILKEGREYGVGIILSTQDISHFKTNENDYSAYILSWVVHRVSHIKNQDIKALFNIDEKNKQEHLMRSIRELEKHQSLYVDGDKNIIKIKDKAFWQL